MFYNPKRGTPSEGHPARSVPKSSMTSSPQSVPKRSMAGHPTDRKSAIDDVILIGVYHNAETYYLRVNIG